MTDLKQTAEFTDEELDEFIERLPRCSQCGEYIFGVYMWEFEKGEILCEDCAREKYRKEIIIEE